MPLDAQNVAVWSTLVSHAGRAGRYQLAYQLHTEVRNPPLLCHVHFSTRRGQMKRRGFKCDMWAYSTILAAFSKISDWSNRTKLLQNAHKTYESYISYLHTVKFHNPTSTELSVIPINAYLTILTKAHQWQKMFDVYNSLVDDGLVQPNSVTYTVMISGLASRSMLENSDDAGGNSIRERNASDARLLWRQMLKRIENGADFQVDAHLVVAIVRALSLGRPADQIAAFDILRDYAGLAKPGESAPPAQVQPSPMLLSDALWLCNVAQKYRLCIHWVQHFMESDPQLLDRGHMDHALNAFGSLAAMGSLTEASRALQMLEWMLEQEATTSRGHRIRPGLSTYTLVLVACWRAKDWDSALRTFELMSGYRGEDFADGATGSPQMTERSQGRNVLPDAAAMSCLVRAATASGDPANQRQCLRIVCHLGVRRYLSAVDEAEEAQRAATRFKKDAYYYAHKTASALVELVDALGTKKTDSSQRTTEEREWLAVRSEAKGFLVAQRHQRPQGTPQLEEQPLGSAAGLAATDEAVQWDRISREQKTTKYTTR